MDGGRKKWLAEGKELRTEVPVPPKKTYRAKDPDNSLRAFLPDAQDAVSCMKPSALLSRRREDIWGRRASSHRALKKRACVSAA